MYVGGPGLKVACITPCPIIDLETADPSNFSYGLLRGGG